MKKQLITGLLAFALAVPGAAAAKGFVSENHDHSRHMEGGKHYHSMEHCKGNMKGHESMLLSWVEKYTPEQKDRWKQAIDERKALYKQWKSPQFAQKRAKWKQARMAERENLKKQVEKGKISKEEMKQKILGKKQKFFKMKHEQHRAFHDLKKAAKNNDAKQAKKLLNQLLGQMELHNKWMKEKMNE